MGTEENQNTEIQINELAVAQYNQIWESMRTHVRFSWQIPAFTVVAVSALLTTAPKNIEIWEKHSLLSGIGFFILSLAIFVLIVHHRRNRIFSNEYQKSLERIEEEYGVKKSVHHDIIANDLKGFDKLSSTKMLTLFLLFLFGTLLLSSFYFFYIYFSPIIKQVIQ